MTPRELEETLWYRSRDFGDESYWLNISTWWDHLQTKNKIGFTDSMCDEFVLALQEVIDESDS